MDKNDSQKRILQEEDFIHCPKSSNSLSKYLAKNDEEVEDSVIARLLMIPEEKVQELYDEAVEKLKAEMADK